MALSVVGTINAFIKDIDWLKAIAPLFLGFFFSFLLQYIGIYANEHRKEKREYENIESRFCGYMNTLLIDSKEENVDFYGLSLHEVFDNLFEFLVSNLHIFKKYVIEETYNDIEEMYVQLRKINRWKYRVLPQDSQLLKESSEQRAIQTRTILEIGKMMREVIEKIKRIYNRLIEK